MWFPKQSNERREIQNLSDQWQRRIEKLEGWSDEIVDLQRQMTSNRKLPRRRKDLRGSTFPEERVRRNLESAAAEIDDYRTVLEVRSKPEIRASETEVFRMAHEAILRITGTDHWTDLAQAITFAVRSRGTAWSIGANALRERIVRSERCEKRKRLKKLLSASLNRRIPDLRKTR